MRTSKLVLLAIASAILASSASALGTGDVDCSTATLLSVGTLTGQQSSASWPSQSPTSIVHDVDWYRFTVQPGQRMDVDLTVTQSNGPHYIFMRLNEFDPTTCPGASVGNSFTLHISAENQTPAPKEYVMTLYAGVTNPMTSVVVTYDVTLQATTVQTGVSYCPGAPNSLGVPATLVVQGTSSIGANDLVFQGAQLPPSTIAMLAKGTSPTQVAFGDGFRCITGSVSRLRVAPASAAGTWSLPLDIPSLPPAAGITAGSPAYFQLYYRNPAGPLGSGFNLSNGLAVTFVP
jgi:hypothetical protein